MNIKIVLYFKNVSMRKSSYENKNKNDYVNQMCENSKCLSNLSVNTIFIQHLLHVLVFNKSLG